LISCIEPSICARFPLATVTSPVACVVRSAAKRELSAFLRVIEVISAADADVSSSDAACSDVPCANDCAELET